MTTKFLKSEIMDDLKHMMEVDKGIVMNALINGTQDDVKTFVHEYLKHRKMYELLMRIDWEMFQVEVEE